MNLAEKQAEKYLEEAELTLYSAMTLFEKAKEEDKELWANIVKTCYDAVEQAISAAIAKKDEIISKEHPLKIKKFINLYEISEEIKNKIYFWLGKRSSTQYIDIKNDVVSVPHELFREEDANRALEESREILDEIRKILA